MKLVKFFFYGLIALAPVLLILWMISIFFGVDLNLVDLLKILLGNFLPGIKVQYIRAVSGLVLIIVIFVLGIVSSILGKGLGKGVYFWIEKLFQKSLQKHKYGIVAFQYFRKEIWVVGFVTGYIEESKDLPGGRILKVFVPGVPVPATGAAPILIQEKDVIYLNISIEEAVNMFISAGFVGVHALPELVERLKENNRDDMKDGIQ